MANGVMWKGAGWGSGSVLLRQSAALLGAWAVHAAATSQRLHQPGINQRRWQMNETTCSTQGS
jgi:hypothetical protein